MNSLSTWRARYPELDAALSADPDAEKILAPLFEAGLEAGLEKYLSFANAHVWQRFFSEAARLDLAHIARHREALKNPETKTLTGADLDPFPIDPAQKADAAGDAALGLRLQQEGAVALLVFAGGSGTRFFSQWDKLGEALPVLSEALRETAPEREAPKGAFPITPVAGLTFYQALAAEVLARGIKAGRLAPLLFMTSLNTHAHTLRWLSEDKLWGLPKTALLPFTQHEIPRLDEDGDLLIKPDGSLFWTGNGHGGVYAALAAEDASGRSPLQRLREAGVAHLVMGNVDNAELNPLAPARLGYHVRTGSAFTMSVVTREEPNEKVGLVCRRKDTGQVEVIEYSVLDPALAAETAPEGGLRFDAAHINTNILNLDAWRADLPGTLYTGKPVKVGETEIKSSTFEMLNQHLASLLDPARVHVYDAPRAGSFTPTKAIVGIDSVATTFEALSTRTRETLRRLGAETAETAYAELHPALGLDDEERRARGVGKGWVLETGSRLYLCVRHGLDGAPPVGEGLHLEAGATLIVRVALPYGRLHYDENTRAISEDLATAGRLALGKNVRIKAGVRVVIDIDGAGRLVIPDGSVFPKDQCAHVAGGATLTLRA